MLNLNNPGISINSDPSQAGPYDYRPLWRISRPDYAINLAGDCINCETGQFLTLNKGKWFILFDKIAKTQTRYRRELLVGIATALGIQRHEVQKLSKKLNLPLISTKTASLDDDTLHTIFNYLQEGKPNREIAQLVNIDIQRVNNIRIRQRYADKSAGYIWPETDTVR